MQTNSTGLSHKRVLGVAIPIVLANATIPILGAVDTAVVGQLGLAAPIGAVGIGAIIITAIYWLFGFLRMGTTGLTAQAIGSGDKPETSALLVRGIIIGLVAGSGINHCTGTYFFRGSPVISSLYGGRKLSAKIFTD